ncbi:MAG: hypothetical protein LBD85_05725 [Oscillospiraceae bacterium]|jgi:hypothetical protein|nr:hypothetical protein [Oscillospiraceae bacterium]
MKNLQSFLEPIGKDEKKTLVISERFIDPETKKPIPFEIKVVTTKANASISKRSKRLIGKQRSGEPITEIDGNKYSSLLIVEGTVYPDFRNAELAAGYGLADPADVVDEMLYPGEKEKLANAIAELSGFNLNPELIEEEAKN